LSEDLRTIRRAFGEIPALGVLTGRARIGAACCSWNSGTLPLLAFHPAAAGHGLNLQHGGSRMRGCRRRAPAELTEQAIAQIYLSPGTDSARDRACCVAMGTVDD